RSFPPDSFTAVVEQALAARSVAVADGVQTICEAVPRVVAPDGAPSVIAMFAPLWVIVELVKLTDAVTCPVLPRLTLPSGSCVVLAESQIWTLSLPAPPSIRRRVTVVAVPAQPFRIELGSIVSLYVNV